MADVTYKCKASYQRCKERKDVYAGKHFMLEKFQTETEVVSITITGVFLYFCSGISHNFNTPEQTFKMARISEERVIYVLFIKFA